ncbi:MAG: hypothetical protein ACXABY_07460, partial [Candidatus Thorarchaeota archaeon]
PRTTFTGSLLSTKDIIEIRKVLAGLGFRGDYVLQNYVASSGVRQSEKAKLSTPDISEIESMRDKTPDGVTIRLEWR